MPLYEVAILEQPTTDGANTGESEKLVFGPKAVVAKDQQSAAIVALLGENIKIDKFRMTVLTRPFLKAS
jgi:hypothetical protein